MRALVVADSPSALEPARLRVLASEADLVIAADGGAARCLAADVEPDIVVGDLDSLDEASRDTLIKRGIAFVHAQADKDESDLDLAIAEARRRSATELVVAGTIGGRLDHELAALGTIARAADLAPVIEDDRGIGKLLSADGRPAADIPGPRVFSLIPLLGPAVVTCTDAHWPLTNAELAPISSLGLSNRVADGASARVIVHAGVLLLYLPE